MNQAFSKILVLVILIALAGGGILAWQHFGAPKEEIKTPETGAQIQNLEIIPSQVTAEGIVYSEGAKAVVTGKNLAKVEFRQRGGGQIYTSPEGGLVGVGIKTETEEGKEKWEILLPSERLMSEFCALGFNANGEKIGEVCLFNVMGVSKGITVTSPKKGEIWEKGKTYEIRWLPSNPEEIVEIRLNKTNETTAALVNQWAKANILNTGSYLFTVPTEIPIGELYQVCVINITKGYVEAPMGCSELFGINRECAKEGGFPCDVLGCTACCEGLVKRDVTHPYKTENNEIVCLENMTLYTCVKCEDTICGKGEDWCICPEDCSKPNPEDLQIFIMPE